ncbi:MAG: hypothetical protein CM15mP19_00250 [Gammaproteobacteria bacterium]|nr:MAG: hypothetical protein CM15mP19_00250 [Gammaproteobacteria bacterium]
MKIVYSHLLNLLEQQPKLEELSELLFQLGHEHEIDGEVLDMEITPNRGDCLSLKGLARDLNYFYQAKELPKSDMEMPALDLQFDNKAQELCLTSLSCRLKLKKCQPNTAIPGIIFCRLRHQQK